MSDFRVRGAERRGLHDNHISGNDVNPHCSSFISSKNSPLLLSLEKEKNSSDTKHVNVNERKESVQS